MSRYDLSAEVRKEYIPIVKAFLDKVDAITVNEIEHMTEDEFVLPLSDTKLNPYTLQKILEEYFGYDDADMDTNGWEMDFWITLHKSIQGLTRKVAIRGTGITFELNLVVVIE